MKYTEEERNEALTLSQSNHTITGALKALTLSNKYLTLKAKIYDETSSVQVRLNELAFIKDYDTGVFQLSERPSHWVLRLEDEDGTEYYLFKGVSGAISTMYTFTPDVFEYVNGFDQNTIEMYEDALGGEFVEVF